MAPLRARLDSRFEKLRTAASGALNSNANFKVLKPSGCCCVLHRERGWVATLFHCCLSLFLLLSSEFVLFSTSERN